MNAMSNQSRSRRLRLASAGLLGLALLAGPQPARAVVSPSSGYYEFTLYKDANCEGDTLQAPASESNHTIESSNLALESFDDVASSWSFCNGTTKKAVVLVTLYTGYNYTGTSTVSSFSAPSGQCITKTQISPDNSVRSFSTYTILE
jgi:hypothetical protein